MVLKVKLVNLKILWIYCLPAMLFYSFSVGAVYDCFIPLSLCLTSAVGFKDLSRLTGGGFAAGSSFSLMREMEPFAAYIHFFALCLCVWVHACVRGSVCLCVCGGSVSVYVCGFVKYYVCVWVSVFLCVAMGFVFEHLCVCEFHASPLHTLFQILSSCETEETEQFMWLLNTAFHFPTVCWCSWLASLCTPGGIQLRISSSVELYYKLSSCIPVPVCLCVWHGTMCSGSMGES